MSFIINIGVFDDNGKGNEFHNNLAIPRQKILFPTKPSFEERNCHLRAIAKETIL